MMFDDSSNSDENDGFTINKDYAAKYQKWRQAEELQKLKDKYGDVETSDSESSTSEDEEGEALTANVEKGWLKTLAALKNKDPRIYQKDVKFYSSGESSSESEPEPSTSQKKKEKPLYLKDVQRQKILQKQEQENSDSGLEDSDSETETKPGYYEQQEEIRKSLALAVEDSDESDADLLTRRTKTKEEKDKEEEEYLGWLKGRKTTLSDDQEVGKDLQPLRDYWNKPDLDPGERFLKDFILNRKYRDKDADRIPTYDEIVDDADLLSEDEEEIEIQEKFERKYNFRFEEPGSENIKSFPRNIEESVRRKDTRRKEMRQLKEQRKREDKSKRQDEIKQLKSLKRQEIEQKIEHLQQIAGNKSIGFNMADLEGDFDPAEHDRMMANYFADQYYDQVDENDQKPVFSNDDDDDYSPENWDNWQGGEGEVVHADDPNFVMDADYDPTQDTKSEKKKKKKKSKLAKALEKSKPVFDPNEKTFEEYVQEYYDLDYEDVVGGMPCRFKYRNVTANSFGLSVDEIMKCRDKELNSWVSVKKMSQYRSDKEETQDVFVYSKRAKGQKKLNILTSLQESEETASTSKDENQGSKKKKRKRKKDSTNESTDKTESNSNDQPQDQSEQFQKKRKESETFSKDDPVSNAETKSRKRKKLKKGSGLASEVDMPQVDSDERVSARDDSVSESSNAKKSKKKLKQNLKNTSAEMTMDSADGASSKTKSGSDVTQKKNEKGRKKHWGISDERLKAYGLNPKKVKYMKRDNFKKKSK